MTDDYFKAALNMPGKFEFTDDNGRTTVAEGWLINFSAPRDLQAQDAVAGHLDGYHAGHLIPARFGGPGEKRNLVPMPEMINTSYVKSVENEIARCMAYGRVYLRVSVGYDGNGAIPGWVRHQLFWQAADGVMAPIPGKDFTTTMVNTTARMSSMQDPYTLQRIANKDFLDHRNTKGRGQYLH